MLQFQINVLRSRGTSLRVLRMIAFFSQRRGNDTLSVPLRGCSSVIEILNTCLSLRSKPAYASWTVRFRHRAIEGSVLCLCQRTILPLSTHVSSPVATERVEQHIDNFLPCKCLCTVVTSVQCPRRWCSHHSIFRKTRFEDRLSNVML